VNTWLRRLDAVTTDQLTALATERLVPLNRVTLVYLPKPKPQQAAAKPVP
jgi:hypothetical protein